MNIKEKKNWLIIKKFSQKYIHNKKKEKWKSINTIY